ncbi:Sugar (pentulose or hexulose) kinase [Streptomyces zhaozhouensis]|uniref:Sugar (Pentulose or hexulose) kinase n=1 Tax=Streptomyces zhaozhouensis TaxID=1300267 RepID=A0A286DUI2_9ACTN|nr:FGGY family carbohydrate kinase [Streptomyces zhaozhouensis]SOD62308.1 Sugar (pentulose or hexulose) kinase [Streptomyces zhaozhouensis]
MAEPVWIGVDVGTQSVRALAVDEAGRQLAVAARPLTSHRDGVRHEQDPADWRRLATEALAEVAEALAGRPVGALAVCATSGTVLLTDPDGTPRTPGVMYDDTRAAALAATAQEAGADLWTALGYRMQPAWALPKLLWWRDLGLLDGGARLAHQPDVVAAALVGHPVASDTSHALKTGYDLLALRWPEEVLRRLRVDPAVLPDVVRPGTVLGTIAPAAARATGLPAGTPVVAGMTDACAAQLSAGALEIGQWNAVLGTTLALKGVQARLPADPTGAVYSHRAPHGDLWLPGGASSTGAAAVRHLFPDADQPALAELTASAARVETVPVCYPLVGRGERFPFVAPDAEGFLGEGPLAVGDDPETAFAAVLTGVAHVERLSFALLAAAGCAVDGPVALTGGAARNDWWNQLRCDMLGLPVRLPETPEPALGMAVLAAGSVGGDLRAAARRLVRVRRTLTPDPARTASLLPGYRAFLEALAERGWLDPRLAEERP